MRKDNFGLGLIIGVIAGVVAALLLAPQSGKETRQTIRRWKEEHEDLIDGTVESSERLIAKTKHSIEALLHKLNSYLDPNGHKTPQSRPAEEHSHVA